MTFLRKAGIWIISLFLSIAIFALVFGTFTSIDMKEMMGDIYGYADQPTKQEFLDKVGNYCGKLGEMKQQLDEARLKAEQAGVTLEELLEIL